MKENCEGFHFLSFFSPCARYFRMPTARIIHFSVTCYSLSPRLNGHAPPSSSQAHKSTDKQSLFFEVNECLSLFSVPQFLVCGD
jgi:hypothetical protein